jgi:ABC-type multidrug transport system ATPase subunit
MTEKTEKIGEGCAAMLQVRRLEKAIENRTALSIEELDIHAGDVVTVVGQSGSGKTLLIRLLCGMLVPSGGKVLLDGKDVHCSPEARNRIGVMFEEDLSLLKNVFTKLISSEFAFPHK